MENFINDLNDFNNSIKIATVSKTNDENELCVNYEKDIEISEEKVTYAEVTTDKMGNKEITSIFESSDFKKNQQRYYESRDSVIKKGDKASETNYAKNFLACEDINDGKK